MRIFAGMNNFDYTSVPDDLLYSDRRHLDDFGVEDTKSLNYLIEKGIYKLYYTYPHYEKFAKDVFNTAYKICTLALVDSHPKRKFGTYLSIIAEQMHHREDEIGIVLSVILIQIDAHKWKETKSEMSDLGLCIFYEIEQNKDIYYNYFKQVVHNYDKRCANTTVPPDSEFKPREITMGVLRHTCSHWDWNGHFGTDMDKMLDFIFAIGKNEDEQKIISSFLQEETHSSFSKGAEHKYCFEYIDRQIYLRYHAEEENAQIEAEIEKDLMKEYEQQWELDYYKDEFQKLKAENESLHSEIEQLKKKIDDEDQTNTSQNQSADENIQQQLETAQKTIEEQTQTIQELNEKIASLNTKLDEQIDIELNRLKNLHEDTLVTLLKPAFYNFEDDARDFLRRIQGLDNQGVTDVARQFLEDRKIAPSKKGRFIWNTLFAAKLYSCVEQNWTAALRKAN